MTSIRLPSPGVAQWRRFARTLLGCVLSYGIARLASLPELYWAVITTLVVVTQPSLNQALGAGRDQIIGAFIGGLAGVLGVVAMLHGAAPLAVFCVELVPLAAMAAYRPSLRLACVTLVIVVLIPSAGGAPFERPIHRVLEIVIGAGSAFIASFLLPNRAVRAAHEHAAEMLETLGKLIEAYMAQPPDDGLTGQLNRRCSAAEQGLADAIMEAGREHVIVPVKRTKADVIDKLAPLLPRLHRDTQFLGQAIARSAEMSGHPRWQRLADAFISAGEAVRASGVDEAKIEEALRALREFRSQGRDAGHGEVLSFVLAVIAEDMEEVLRVAGPG
jgi:uncharacterized membrane protein YccC